MNWFTKLFHTAHSDEHGTKPTAKEKTLHHPTESIEPSKPLVNSNKQQLPRCHPPTVASQ